MGSVSMGLDLGQRRDSTAIAVVEREWRDGISRREEHFLVRYLERLPLGTPYPEIVTRVTEIVTTLSEQTGHNPTLAVDATGLGSPVIDMFRLARPPAWLIPVYFTHGDRRTVIGTGQQTEISLGKAWLVSRLQTLHQTTCLHLPETADARDLAQELLDYEIRVSEDANDRYGAFAVGTHDDLVTALGLAVQTPLPLVHPIFVGRAKDGRLRQLGL